MPGDAAGQFEAHAASTPGDPDQQRPQASSPPPSFMSTGLPLVPPIVTAGGPKRGYKACLHCRNRKTRCDLGDVNAPSAPPCSRCKREQRHCVFPPSKRRRSTVEDLPSAPLPPSGSTLTPHLATRAPPHRRSTPSGLEGSSQAASSHGVQYPGWIGDAGTHSSFREAEHLRMPILQSHTTGQLLDWNLERTAQAGSQPTSSEPFSFLQQGTMEPQVATTPAEPSPWMTGLACMTPYPDTGHHPFASGSSYREDHQSTATVRQRDSNGSGRSTWHVPATNGSHTEAYGLPMTIGNPLSSSDTSPTEPADGRKDGRDVYPLPTDHQAKRRRHNSATMPKDRNVQRSSDSRDIVAADMHNESDALDILAMAALGGKREKGKSQGGPSRGQEESEHTERSSPSRSEEDFLGTSTYKSIHAEEERPTPVRGNRGASSTNDLDVSMVNHQDHLTFTEGHPFRPSLGAKPSRQTVKIGKEVDFITDSDMGEVPDLSSFPLVEQGIADEEQVLKLCRAFFQWHHHIFPILSPCRIPRTDVAIAQFSRDEDYLLTAMIIIASRPDPSPSMRRIHGQTWELMKGYLTEIAFCGALPTIGLVEGLLLLAENLPRGKPTSSKASPENTRMKSGKPVVNGGAENRQAWMLIGMAIRAAYGLGLDQLSRNAVDSKSTPELERSKLAWTYCYIFDRQISIRTGKAFWSRGPSLCFQGYSHIKQTGPATAADSFPSLSESNPATAGNLERMGADESIGDSAFLVQAYLELTQRDMTNVHDVFYPSTNRLHSLVEHGEYFKYLDDFNSALESFKTIWSRRRWKQFPSSHLVWCMFHYVRLYTCSFAFQAHIQRSSERSKRERESAAADKLGPAATNSFFPRCSASTPDALYIYESIHAAGEILNICVDILHPTLIYLPSRFLLWFLYAAVFLLKAVYSGAMVKADHAATLVLVERTCSCLVNCSTDKEHPAVRYGSMIRLLSKKLSQHPDTSAFPSRVGTPEGDQHRGLNMTEVGPIDLSEEEHAQSRAAVINGFERNLEGTPTRTSNHVNLQFSGDLLDDGDLSNWLSLQANADTWNTHELSQDDLLRRLLDEPAAQTGLSDYNVEGMLWSGMGI